MGMTRHLDVVATDASRTDVGTLPGATLDLTVGDDGQDNDFELTTPLSGYVPPAGALVYVDGTGWGGIVDEREVSTGSTVVTISGRTWSGILQSRVLRPDAGQDYLAYSGDANAMLAALVDRCGLGWLFSVPGTASGITVSGRFDRYCDMWTGIRKALRASGARPDLSWSGTGCVLSAVASTSVEPPEGEVAVTASSDSRPINHLVCLGQGELSARVVVDLYADADGNVSDAQTLFGADLREATYDYGGAAADELATEGRKRLLELQEGSSVTLDISEVTAALQVGDLIAATDPRTGIGATCEVARVIVKVRDALATVSYEAGATTTTTSLSGSAETSSGGVAYTAGDGISISSGTISAEVTQAKLDAVARTAADAATQASNAASTASAAQTVAGAAVQTITATSPMAASRTGNAVSLTHATSGVAAGAYGPAANATPTWGGTATVGAQLSIDARGHVTGASGRTLTVPSSLASSTAKGLMSAADKARLDALQVGGTNLYAGTRDFSGTWVNLAGYWTADGTVDGLVRMRRTTSWHGLYQPVNVSVGESYTLSGWMQGDGTATADVYFNDTSAGHASFSNGTQHLGLVPTVPTRFSAAATVVAAGTMALRLENTVLNATMWVWGLKLEHGNMASDWSPAPGDMLSATDAASTYAARSHEHDASAISTGTLEAGRLPLSTPSSVGGVKPDGTTCTVAQDGTLTCTGATAAGFLAAHPVGSYHLTSEPGNPGVTYGGTWESAPSEGPYAWHRTA